MDRQLSGESDNFTDHIHFSPQGGQKAAELVATQLERVLDQPQQVATADREERVMKQLP